MHLDRVEREIFITFATYLVKVILKDPNLHKGLNCHE